MLEFRGAIREISTKLGGWSHAVTAVMLPIFFSSAFVLSVKGGWAFRQVSSEQFICSGSHTIMVKAQYNHFRLGGTTHAIRARHQ